MYEKYLEQLIDEVFEKASVEWTWREFASQAGVSYTTVYRLGTYKTKLPQLRTAYLLCRACGIELPSILRKNLRIAS
jgi:DNA-binding XRE family transcriptional regulator